MALGGLPFALRSACRSPPSFPSCARGAGAGRASEISASRISSFAAAAEPRREAEKVLAAGRPPRTSSATTAGGGTDLALSRFVFADDERRGRSDRIASSSIHRATSSSERTLSGAGCGGSGDGCDGRRTPGAAASARTRSAFFPDCFSPRVLSSSFRRTTVSAEDQKEIFTRGGNRQETAA